MTIDTSLNCYKHFIFCDILYSQMRGRNFSSFLEFLRYCIVVAHVATMHIRFAYSKLFVILLFTALLVFHKNIAIER